MSKRVWYIYLAIVAAYGLLTFFTPADPSVLERYNVTETQLKLVLLTLFIPIISIFFAAFYGYDRFRRYAKTIRESEDGHAFGQIANGLGVLAISLPLGSLITRFLAWITENSESALPATTIFSNYFTIAYLFLAFWLISRGAGELVDITLSKAKKSQYSNTVLAVTGFLAILYTYFVFHNPNRQMATGDVETAAYYLPDWLILLTIIIPYVLMWFIGLHAVYNIGRYMQSVKGILYKQMLGLLAKGVGAIVIVSVMLEFILNLASSYSSLSLVPILIILYLLLFALGIGFVLVAIGAKRLQKIEEV